MFQDLEELIYKKNILNLVTDHLSQDKQLLIKKEGSEEDKGWSFSIYMYSICTVGENIIGAPTNPKYLWCYLNIHFYFHFSLLLFVEFSLLIFFALFWYDYLKFSLIVAIAFKIEKER